jgi:protein involved in polysaccharide export with SLBB domain
LTRSGYSLLLLFVVLLTGSALALDSVPPDYVLRPGDKIAITLMVGEESYATGPDGLEIPADGKIAFFNTEVQAAGRTRSQVRDDLVKGIQKLILKPQVAVNLISSPYNVITVNGAVEKPNEFPFRKGMTVFEALSLAGGLKDTANTKALVFRRSEDAPVDPLRVDLEKLYDGDMTQNYALQPGDIIQVNEAVIFVDGRVKTPGPIPFRTADSVAKAIAAAKGYDTEADLQNAFIRRGDQTIPLDLRPTVEAGAQSAPPTPLEPGDILFIPSLVSKVSLFGDVNPSGTGAIYLIPHQRDKVLDVLAHAGGVTKTADLSRVDLRRTVNGNHQVEMTLDLGPNGSASNNVILQDGDVIYVPTKKERDRTTSLFTASIVTQILATLRNF